MTRALLLAAVLAAPSASAQTDGAPPDSLFEALRPGESVLEYLESESDEAGSASELLVYLWGDVFKHAHEMTVALDSVAAAAPETAGDDGWAAGERAAFRRAFVRTAVAAAAGQAQIEFATEFTLRLAPETARPRVAALLDNRTDWLRERLFGMADFAATAAACPAGVEATFLACAGLDEPVPWQLVRDDLEAATEELERALSGESETEPEDE